MMYIFPHYADIPSHIIYIVKYYSLKPNSQTVAFFFFFKLVINDWSCFQQGQRWRLTVG